MEGGRQIKQLLNSYIDSSTSIHKERLEHLVQANLAISKEYLSVCEEMSMLKEDSNSLNHDIDAFINTFCIVDEVQKNIKRTQDNIQVIFASIKQLTKKVAQLKKSKKK